MSLARKIIILLTFMLAVSNANSETLTSKVSGLQALQVGYGVNEVRLLAHDIVIVRAEYDTEVSVSDSFSVFEKKGEVWQAISYENKVPHKTVLWASAPGDEERKVVVKFMTSKDMRDLYILYTEQEDVTLYKFFVDKDFGLSSFVKIKK